MKTKSERNSKSNFSKSYLKSEISNIVNELSVKEIEILLYDWEIWSNDLQLAPDGDWTTWLVMGGRGAGKTRTGSEWIRGKVEGATPLTAGSCSAIALIGQTYSDVREIMIEGQSGILNISPKSKRPKFISSRRILEWPNGAKAYCLSSEDPEGIRGFQFDAAWCDELCKWTYAELTWDNLQLALRLGEHPQQICTTTPKNINLLKRIKNNKNTILTIMPTFNNAANLSKIFIDSLNENYKGTKWERQELLGELVEFDENDFIDHRLIDNHRVKDINIDFEEIVIAVDPAVTSNKNSDNCGIIILGKNKKKDNLYHYYIISDETLIQKQPLEWVKKIEKLFYQYQASTIIIEVNQGGDLISTLIGQINPALNITPVRATQNKISRARSMQALYEQGRIHHINHHPELEDEIKNFTSLNHSPDRVDALVWGIIYFQKNKNIPNIKIL